MSATLPGAAEQTDAGQMSGKTIILISALMASMLLAALDQTVVTTALPVIAAKVGVIQQLPWAVTAYMLAMTVVTPVYGKLSDSYGGKPLLIAAVTVFVAGSLAAGLSQGMAELVAARVVQGAGAGGIITLTFSIGSSVIPPRDVGKYQGYSGMVWSLATLGGPVLGGYLAGHGLWRWVFLINVPVGLGAIVVAVTMLELARPADPRPADYPGACLLVAAASCLLLVMVWGGQRYAWGSVQVVALAAGTAMLAAAFVIRELRVPAPLLDLRFFGDRMVTVSVAASFLVGVAMFAIVLFLPVYLQVVKGIPAQTSGVYVLPLWGAVTVSSFATGFAVYKTGSYKEVIIGGSALIAIGAYLFTYLRTGSGNGLLFGAEVVFGAGLGAVISKLIMTVQNTVSREDMGTGIAATQFFRELGSSIGTAIFGALFVARLGYWRPRLLPHGSGASVLRLRADLLRVDPAVMDQLRTSAPARFHTVAQMVALSLRPDLLVAVPFAVLAFGVLWLLPRRPLRGQEWEAPVDSHSDNAAPQPGK
jgi:EmrB/QacA subfamily drug resistance transporter